MTAHLNVSDPVSLGKRARPWLVVLGLVACFVGLPKGYAEERDSWSLESRIPSTSLGIITMDKVETLQARFEKTAIAGLLREPEMKAFFAPMEKAMTEALDAGEDGPLGEAGPMIQKVSKQLQHLHGQVAIAVIDFDKEKEMPRAVASLDFGNHVAEFVTFVQTLRAEIDPEGNNIREYEKDGRTWWQVQDGPPITATAVDTAFVIATDEKLLDGVIAGVGEKHIGANEHFQAVRRKAGGDDLAFFAFANVPAIADMLAAELDEEGMRIANHLGLDTVKGAAYGMAFAGDGFMDSFIIHAPGADHGIVPLIRMPAFKPHALPFASENAFYLSEGAMNIDELIPNVRALVSGIEPGAVEEMNEGLAQANEMLGVDIEKELLGGLAGSVGAYAGMPETGGLTPEFAYILKLKDPAAFEATMQRAMSGLAGTLTEDGGVIASTRVLEYREHKLHLFEMQAARGDDVIPFTPTWSIMGDACVITLVPHTMKEIVLRRGDTGGGLAAQEDYQSLRKVMPKSAGAFTYFDLQAVMSLVYETSVPILQAAVKPNMLGKAIPFELDWAQLPAGRTVRPYFRSLGVFTTWDGNGLSIQMHAPLPMMGAMILGGIGAATYFATAGAPRGPMMAPGRVRLETERRPTRPMPGGAKGRTAMLQAQQIGSYVRVFVLTQKRLPADLDEIVSKDVAASMPTDPWGNAYKLEVVDAKTKRFRVRSGGPDGQFGTKDDVTAGG